MAGERSDRLAGGRAIAAPAPLAGASLSLSGVGRWFAALFAEEIAHRRLFPWAAVAFGCGAIFYFAAEREPWAPAPLLAAAVFACLALLARARQARIGQGLALAAALMAAGFSAGALRTLLVSGPVLQRLTVASVTGFIETVDDRKEGGRLLLRVLAIEGLETAQTPRRLRVTTRTKPGVKAGVTIRATMRLLPPSRASQPGGYDFARDAFFAGVGGVGNVVSRLETVATPDSVPHLARLMAAIDNGRNALTDRIVTVVSQRAGASDGAVAAALVTGKRGQIPEETNEALRAAGIYHVVSISGLHMVLAAGLFLWGFRAVAALFPSIALVRPVKTWAAIFALGGAVAYDVFSGSEVATERSLIMTGAMLVAVIFGRPAMAMRNLALAAFAIIALRPEQIMGPSFQMSFAAVAGLIAAFEKGPGGEGAKQPDPSARFGLLGERVKLVLWATFVSTLVASLTTDPFATFHFNRLTPYGLIGNTLTLPLVEFLVMPAALIGVVALPFGLDGPVWTVMGWGVSFMMAVARWVATLPGVAQMVPAFGAGALGLMALAICWATIWRTALRWFAAPIFLAGLALAAQAKRPDVFVDATARTMAVRGVDGALHVANERANPFGVSQWLLADADRRSVVEAGAESAARCDGSGCVVELGDGRAVALVFQRSALPEDCGRAAIVITALDARGACAGPALVLDAAHFLRHGATSLRITPQGVETVTDRGAGFDRPWSPARPAPAPAAPRAPPRPEPADGGEPEPDLSD